MSTNPLTLEYLSEIFSIDIDAGTIHWKVARAACIKIGDEAGCITPRRRNKRTQYRIISINSKNYYAHQIIWFVANGYWLPEIDHKNRNGLDNRISNLRPATDGAFASNSANIGIRKDNKTGVKGAYWDKRTKCYRVQIQVNKKMIHLGYFKDRVAAARAYDATATQYFGEYAVLNLL